MNALLFGVGALVTLLVLASMGLLVWGAVLDGRYNEAERRREQMRSRGTSGRASAPKPLG